MTQWKNRTDPQGADAIDRIQDAGEHGGGKNSRQSSETPERTWLATASPTQILYTFPGNQQHQQPPRERDEYIQVFLYRVLIRHCRRCCTASVTLPERPQQNGKAHQQDGEVAVRYIIVCNLVGTEIMGDQEQDVPE